MLCFKPSTTEPNWDKVKGPSKWHFMSNRLISQTPPQSCSCLNSHIAVTDNIMLGHRYPTICPGQCLSMQTSKACGWFLPMMREHSLRLICFHTSIRLGRKLSIISLGSIRTFSNKNQLIVAVKQGQFCFNVQWSVLLFKILTSIVPDCNKANILGVWFENNCSTLVFQMRRLKRMFFQSSINDFLALSWCKCETSHSPQWLRSCYQSESEKLIKLYNFLFLIAGDDSVCPLTFGYCDR